MKIIPILLSLGLLSASGAVAQNTQKLTASKANEYGLVYSLPRTAVDITVVTETTVLTPGEFANYARLHLGLDDAVRVPETKVSVKEVIISTRGVPDADNRWMAQFKSGTPVSMLLNAAGIPLAVNAEEAEDVGQPALPQAVPMSQSPLQTDAARQALTLEMTRSTSLSKKAELAAQRIFEMREQRNELISGNADNMPQDGGSLKIALDALNAQEAALTAMFAGTVQTGTQVNTFSVIPADGEIADSVVARISPLDGVTSTDDLRGIPLTMSLSVLQRGQLPVTEKGEAKKFPKGGVAYTIPGTARITVSYNGREVATATVELAQLGETFGLDPGLFSNKKSPMQARFSPVTGAITELEPMNGSL